MTQSNQKHFPKNDEKRRSSTRKRRRRRPSYYGKFADRNVFLGNLIHAATPSANYYSLSLLTAFLLIAATYFNLRPLFILAIISAPFMAPIAGLSFATVSGSVRFFIHSLGALLIGAILVFGMGALGGVASGIFPEFSQINSWQMIHFTWADTLLLLAGTIFMSLRLYRDPLQYPRLASVAVAYELYLPLSIAGYALANGQLANLQNGLIYFTFHVSLAFLTGAAVYTILGLRLRLHRDYSLAGSIFLTIIACAIIIAGYGSINDKIPKFSIASQIFMTPTSTVLPTKIITRTEIITPTITPTATQQFTVTTTSTETPEITITNTTTFTSEPKPYLAIVKVSGAQGAYIRAEPAGAVVNSILNGKWVEIQPQYKETTINDAVWVYIRTDNGIEGWMMKSLLDITATTPTP